MHEQNAMIMELVPAAGGTGLMSDSR